LRTKQGLEYELWGYHWRFHVVRHGDGVAGSEIEPKEEESSDAAYGTKKVFHFA